MNKVRGAFGNPGHGFPRNCTSIPMFFLFVQPAIEVFGFGANFCISFRLPKFVAVSRQTSADIFIRDCFASQSPFRTRRRAYSHFTLAQMVMVLTPPHRYTPSQRRSARLRNRKKKSVRLHQIRESMNTKSPTSRPGGCH